MTTRLTTALPNGDVVDEDGTLVLRAVEARASVDNLEELQAKRRALVAQYAPLAAKFNSTGAASSDAARKRHRALIAKRILMTHFAKSTTQPSETALERMANADDDHIAFCAQLEQDFIRYTVLANEIADVTEQVRNREELLRVFRAEIMLGGQGT